jgi:hypothetical protein
VTCMNSFAHSTLHDDYVGRVAARLARRLPGCDDPSPAWIAKRAFAVADALLAERSRRCDYCKAVGASAVGAASESSVE